MEKFSKKISLAFKSTWCYFSSAVSRTSCKCIFHVQSPSMEETRKRTLSFEGKKRQMEKAKPLWQRCNMFFVFIECLSLSAVFLFVHILPHQSNRITNGIMFQGEASTLNINNVNVSYNPLYLRSSVEYCTLLKLFWSRRKCNVYGFQEDVFFDILRMLDGNLCL